MERDNHEYDIDHKNYYPIVYRGINWIVVHTKYGWAERDTVTLFENNRFKLRTGKCIPDLRIVSISCDVPHLDKNYCIVTFDRVVR